MFDFETIDRVNEFPTTDKDIVLQEIRRFLTSKERRAMIDGQNYYVGKQDILKRKREAIGENGDLVEIKNLPNNQIVDNQYRKMVIQKTNYLVGQPITVSCDNEQYSDLLNDFFNKKFMRLLKNTTKNTLNCGKCALYVYYDNNELKFKKLNPTETIFGWKDDEHTELEYVIRVFDVLWFDGNEDKLLTKVEVYDETGISYFELKDDNLISCEPYKNSYIQIDGMNYNWERLPFIVFKYNEEETPLIVNAKSIQDAINLITSNFQNNMEEDVRNTILILSNYDGQNLGEFRRNLATYGAVKVKTVDGSAGGVTTLEITVNSENYKSILEILKKALIENCMGYDAKDDRLSGNPNQMNIQSMYNDIDLDANNVETEFQASFDDLLYFINLHFLNFGFGDFRNEKVNIIFNRDMMMNESDVINNIKNSVGILSTETLIAQHPWTVDVQFEIDKLNEEKQESIEQYQNAFGGDNSDGDVDE